MRQSVGRNKVHKYAVATGLPLVGAMVRGNTGHRVDLLVQGGDIYHYDPKTNGMYKSVLRWLFDDEDEVAVLEGTARGTYRDG